MIAWYEILVADMNRAKKFYEAILDITIQVNNLGGFIMGLLPDKPRLGQANGALLQHEQYRPSLTDGVLVYIGCEDVAKILEKVEQAGGTILKLKTEIGDGHGFMGLIQDSEGNRIALHSIA